MKILHVETGKNLYGGAYQVLQLLNGLNNSRFENLLFCPSGSRIATMAKHPTEVYKAPLAGELDPRFFFHLHRAIKKFNPDILHAHSRRGADFWCALTGRVGLYGKVLTRRVDNPEQKWLARTKYRFYDRIIVISEAIGSVLLSEGVPKAKISVVRSAVDFCDYQEISDKNWFCKEFGFSRNKTVIGMISQFIPRKGHRYLIEAIPQIVAKFPHLRVLLLGKGPLKEDLRKQCKKAGIEDYVRFAGFRKDIPKILPCLDLVIHPALKEGLGVALIQAAAAGVPIVATRVGGIPEIVRDGFNGLLIDPESTEEIVSTLSKLLSEPGTAKRLGENGKKLAADEFSTDSMVQGNIKVYQQLISSMSIQ